MLRTGKKKYILDIEKNYIKYRIVGAESSERTLKSFPKFAHSGMVESILSYASAVDGGPLGGAPKPVGFLPGAFFSARGWNLTSLGTELMSKASSEGSYIHIKHMR